MQRRVTMSAEKGDHECREDDHVVARVAMSAEKGDHECREGGHECREG